MGKTIYCNAKFLAITVKYEQETAGGNDAIKKVIEKIVSVVGGTLIGFVNGFFGSGGGMLVVPLLEKGLKENTRVAHATAILIILPVSIASAIMYFLKGFAQLEPILYASIGVIAGGIAGALLLKKLPPFVTGIVFALSMIGVGIKLII